MKARLAIGVALVFGMATFTFAADQSWTGYISDSHCGAKGAKEGHAECAEKCVKEKGAKYVFVSDSDHKVYNIEDQSKVAAHAGHHVTLKGTESGDNIKVDSVAMAK